jgi:hypothetical protein
MIPCAKTPLPIACVLDMGKVCVYTCALHFLNCISQRGGYKIQGGPYKKENYNIVLILYK